ncbi:hypothetical protein N7476_000136 [Penicillium atrosanguineum]|uniref:Secreted protein n=1 Tax=Penicillium atrosanguineum TaxID=1132637 RepID=A0A9W9QDZ4_9EURO|nr:hypothetical protein N7476_000136 [Penicillium atrosanguineum]
MIRISILILLAAITVSSYEGYLGGQLPKVYHVSNSNYTYIPELAFQEFNGIIAGKQNASHDLFTGPETPGVERRYNTNQLAFSLIGDSGRDGYLINTDGACRSGSHAPWRYIAVYYAGEGYMTFWKSTVCNGHKGSFNPVCNDQDDAGQICDFTFEPSSFRAYSGCHRQYASGGCSSTSP